jgi:protein-tyrosine-phosphatase
MATVLFVCLQNAGRSQMSQALFTRAAGGAHHALSAGTTPSDRVHAEVIEDLTEPSYSPVAIPVGLNVNPCEMAVLGGN